MTVPVKQNCSWILKTILLSPQVAKGLQEWNNMMLIGKFIPKKIYLMLQNHRPTVSWKSLFFYNFARSQAKFTVWMACHNSLATKERLHRFSMLDCELCYFCSHLFFKCRQLAIIWHAVKNWLQCEHHPKDWIIECSKGKGHKVILLKAIKRILFFKRIIPYIICG